MVLEQDFHLNKQPKRKSNRVSGKLIVESWKLDFDGFHSFFVGGFHDELYLINKNEFPSFSAGDTLTVTIEIREGDKVRPQSFKGVVIQRRGSGNTETFTIRKMSGSVGVERIFPVNLPALQKIEINKKGKVRRSRIYYFKQLRGKKARIKEARMDS